MLSPFVVLGIAIGAIVLLLLLILGIAWRICGCPVWFNQAKKRARQPQLKVIPPKNHSAVKTPRYLGPPPGATKPGHRPGSPGVVNGGFEGTIWKGAATSANRGGDLRDVKIEVTDGSGLDGVDSGFSDIATLPKSTINRKQVTFSGDGYSQNPETGEATFIPPATPVASPPTSPELIRDFGRLLEERTLLQFRHLTRESSEELHASTSEQLQDMQQQLRTKQGAVINALVTEKISEVQRAMVDSQSNYQSFMEKLIMRDPPRPETLLAKEQFINEILLCILTYIADCFPRFTGHVEGYGSYFSGHFGGSSPDYDYQYILHAFDLNDPQQIQVRERKDAHGKYDLIVGSPELYETWKDCIVEGNQLDSQKLLNKLQEVLFHTVQHVILPAEATHGGVLTPCFSGVRGYSRALCVQYVWKGEVLRIDLVPSLMAPRAISSKVVVGLHPELRATLVRTLPEPEANLESLMTITAGTDWSLSHGLLQRQVLQMFDLNPTLGNAKKSLGLIRQHILRIPAVDLHDVYTSIANKLSETMQYTHKVEIAEHLDRLAEAKQWDLFVLLMMATANSHPELKDNFCEYASRQPDFHKCIPASLAQHCHDCVRSTLRVKGVLLMDLLIKYYLSNIEEFHSPSPQTSEFQVVQDVLQQFSHAVRRSGTIEIPFIGVFNDAIIHTRDDSMPLEDLDTAYVKLVGSTCRMICENG